MRLQEAVLFAEKVFVERPGGYFGPGNYVTDFEALVAVFSGDFDYRLVNAGYLMLSHLPRC